MKTTSTLFTAALAASSLLNPGTQATGNAYASAIAGVVDPPVVFNIPADIQSPDFAGNSFSIGPFEELANGVVVGDTYFFSNASAGLSDGLDHLNPLDHGGQLLSGSESSSTVLTGVVLEDSAGSVNVGPIKAGSFPEFPTWAMLLAGLAGIGLAGDQNKALARSRN
jgi:hypothetical protein